MNPSHNWTSKCSRKKTIVFTRFGKDIENSRSTMSSGARTIRRRLDVKMSRPNIELKAEIVPSST